MAEGAYSVARRAVSPVGTACLRQKRRAVSNSDPVPHSTFIKIVKKIVARLLN